MSTRGESGKRMCTHSLFECVRVQKKRKKEKRVGKREIRVKS